MSGRMQIRGFLHEELADDGLPPMPQLPPGDWQMPKRVVGLRMGTDAYSAASVCSIARNYARTCLVAQDMEIHVLTAERDALKTQLDELRGNGSR